MSPDPQCVASVFQLFELTPKGASRNRLLSRGLGIHRNPLIPCVTGDRVGYTGKTPIRLAATIATAIGLLGLVQALIGLYGVVAYSVAQREREIGIRMAMGATSRDIVGAVLREGMALTGAGLSIGFLASLAATGVLRSLLIGISVRDPVTFGVLAALLATVTLAACGIPAVRGSRVAPAEALRGGG